MERTILNAVKRTPTSKGYLHSIRREGKVPGVFYIKNREPISVEVLEKEINPLVFTSDTHIVSLNVDGKEISECIIKDIQFDPVTDRVIHFDLLGIVKGEKIELEVPIQFTGSPIGVREGGILQMFHHKLKVLCVPDSIPSNIEIKIADLSVGMSVHVKDLDLPDLEILNSKESIIVSVTAPRVVKETEAETTEVVQPEVIAKGKEKDKSEE